jgi:divalent metal cation (Fe/Co/Zn/Cd) transporter
LHLELKGEISLGEAHSVADEFEKRAAGIIYEPLQIITHLEPIPDRVLQPGGEIALAKRERYLEMIAHHTSPDQVLELNTYRQGGRVGVAVKVGAAASASLNEAHNLAETIERELITHFPEIHRVTVHVEPESAV